MQMILITYAGSTFRGQIRIAILNETKVFLTNDC